MTVKIESLRANVKRETEGDWIDIPDLPGVRLKVRSFHYGPFRIARDQLNQRLVRKYGREPIPADEASREYGRLYHEHILLDWEGFDVEYDTDIALDMLLDPAYRTLIGHIEYAASKIAAVEAEFIEKTTKN
jgi:hypothetical protein